MARERIRQTMGFRRARVTGVTRPTPDFVRVTLAGADLADFRADGPADHVKVYFPNPVTGVLTAPTWSEEHGVERPTDGLVISRDYTPRAWRPAAEGRPAELDIDFFLYEGLGEHGNGPASSWAAGAAPGGEVAVGGPKGSLLAPAEARHALLVADETGLPALARWIDMLPAGCAITAVVLASDEATEAYLTAEEEARAGVEWLYRFDGPGQLEEAVHSIDLADDAYVFAAGEAGELLPVRRMLKRDRHVDADHLQVQGYWKRGVTNRDHHAPIDPSDPD
ncbi:MAG TPA: siderophore-interacting protein [Microbacteriaceae bacterium]|nr:siderophore-interacting protein [Microbacteriaceae bacterium]